MCQTRTPATPGADGTASGLDRMLPIEPRAGTVPDG